MCMYVGRLEGGGLWGLKLKMNKWMGTCVDR